MVPVSVDIKEESSKFEPFNFFSDNEVNNGTDYSLPALSYKDVNDIIHQVNNIIDQNIVIGKTFLLPYGEDGEVICSQVKAWASKSDQE